LPPIGAIHPTRTLSSSRSRRGSPPRRAPAHPFASQALILEGDQARAVLALQAPDDEMAAGEGLEMVGEDGVDRRAADRPENRRRLCRQLLADDDAETRGDLRYQPRRDGHGMGAEPLLRDKARAVAHRF